jgi:hypothetical protein
MKDVFLCHFKTGRKIRAVLDAADQINCNKVDKTAGSMMLAVFVYPVSRLGSTPRSSSWLGPYTMTNERLSNIGCSFLPVAINISADSAESGHFEMYISAQMVKKFRPFRGPECSLP